MSTIILLSSSPPRVFARSPTPVGFSSPSLPSPNAILRGDVEGRKRFKTSPVKRDGFVGSFTSARALLGTKIGAENVPVGLQWRQEDSGNSPCKENAKSMQRPGDRSWSRTTMTLQQSGALGSVDTNERCRKPHKGSNRLALGLSHTLSQRADDPEDRVASPLPSDPVSTRSVDSTLRSEPKASSRPDHGPARSTTFFPDDLLGSFGYNGGVPKQNDISQRRENGGPTKRRKIDPAQTDVKILAAPEAAKSTIKGAPVTVRKRTKSPTKKYTTITGLATSRYFAEEIGQEKTTPMMQYLTATQARAADDSEDPKPCTAKLKPKRAPRKSKKPVSKFKVLSPQTALKALDSQETLFGSASQLARDESPTLTRETLQAMKQSESFLMSDPVSTQMTQPISIESTTPRTVRGTARFAKTKSLWSAAGRDEDNALLHVDTVDLFDTPAVRLAFQGKDVLLEPGLARGQSPQRYGKLSPSLRGGHLSSGKPAKSLLFDIDDITTPATRTSKLLLPTLQARSMHTAVEVNDDSETVSQKQSSQGLCLPRATEELLSVASGAKGPPKAKPKVKAKRKPVKPAYTGFTIEELQKRISAYGFKPIKKREKMIEILDQCWEDKHGPADHGKDNEAEDVEALTHADFLSKVHGISSRPVPKVPKPKRPKKQKADDGQSDGAKNKDPRKRKKAEPKEPKQPREPKVKVARKAAGPRTKTPRKRKSRVSAVSEEYVVDVDEIDDSTLEAPKPASANKAAATAKALSKSINSTTRTATPAPTIPEIASATAPILERPPLPELTPQPAPATTSSSPVQVADMAHQISQAITTFKPEHGRDHQRHPTWHEKILMYDPIVLEDLATWLNTEGFARIAEDREVSALEVRAWCEARGVCCLWRGGWRGNGAKGVGRGADVDED